MSLPVGPEVMESQDLNLRHSQHPLGQPVEVNSGMQPVKEGVGRDRSGSPTPTLTGQSGDGRNDLQPGKEVVDRNRSGSPVPTLVEDGIAEDEKPKGLAFALIISESNALVRLHR